MKNFIFFIVVALISICGCSHSGSGGCTNTFTINGDGHTNEVFTLQTEPVSYLNGLVVTYNSNTPVYTLINSIAIPYTSALNSNVTIQANLPNLNLGSHTFMSATNHNSSIATDSTYMTLNLVDNLGNSHTYSSYSQSGSINIQSIPNCTGGGGSMTVCNLSGQFNNIVLVKVNQYGNPIVPYVYITLSNSSFCAQKQF
jgi:hypothetical protein